MLSWLRNSRATKEARRTDAHNRTRLRFSIQVPQELIKSASTHHNQENEATYLLVMI